MKRLPLFASLALCAGLGTGTAQDSGLPKFGLAISAGTTGVGIQAGTALMHSANLRVAGNYFSYSRDFDKDGIAYNGTLKLQSAEALYDQYIGKVFHVSPGVMFYDGNKGTAAASVPGGQSFSLGSSSYVSDPANPVSGTGQISARKVAPELLIGFGNLLPRGNHHFAANVEFGVVFQGSPTASLNLNGGTCVGGAGCLPIGSNPLVQASIVSEQTKINNSLAVFKYYPIVRVAFGYRF